MGVQPLNPRASSKTIAAGRSHSALHTCHCPIWPHEPKTHRKARAGQEESKFKHTFHDFCWSAQSSTVGTAWGTVSSGLPANLKSKQPVSSRLLLLQQRLQRNVMTAKPVRKHSMTTFTSKNRTPGDFDRAGFSWHSRTFLTVCWLLAVGPISREKRPPQASRAEQGLGRSSPAKELACMAEVCLHPGTFNLLLHKIVQVQKGEGRSCSPLWSGSKPEGTL